MKLDILAVCAHPDDAELHCAGLLLQAAHHGATIGVVDMTRGEAASRGTPARRRAECEAASAILNLAVRDNLEAPDARLGLDDTLLLAIIGKLRQYRPKLVITAHWDDHHPDHHYTSLLVRDACYLAGLARYPAPGAPHRPEQVLYYLDRVATTPQVVQDVSAVFDQKLAALRCYASQFEGDSEEQSQQTTTILSAPGFLERWRARHMHMGSLIGVEYGEGYVLRSPVALSNPLNLAFGRQGMV